MKKFSVYEVLFGSALVAIVAFIMTAAVSQKAKATPILYHQMKCNVVSPDGRWEECESDDIEIYCDRVESPKQCFRK